MIPTQRARAAWATRLRHGLATLALLGGAACGGNPVEGTLPEPDTDAAPPISCTPGEALSCTCANGQMGTQRCLDTGHEISGCMCGGSPTTTDPGTTGNETDGDAESGSTSGTMPATMDDSGTDSGGDSSGDGSSTGSKDT